VVLNLQRDSLFLIKIARCNHFKLYLLISQKLLKKD